MIAAPPFAPLERVVAKYRRDVHSLPAGAAPEALTALEGHLGRALPPGMRTFLSVHNGATLFRGALQIRSTSEVALASEATPQVVLFADERGEKRWAWAPDGAGGFVFGPWDGERLDPLHGSFAGWLAGTLALLDTRVQAPHDRAALRFEAAPDDPWQLIRAGERALRAGQPDDAETWLRRAIQAAPTRAVAWQLLGDALAISDRTAARRAWLQAFRHTALPAPWPGAPHIDPEVLRSLRAAFPDPEKWERALQDFLADQARDVSSESESRVLVAAARELARVRLERGRRTEARDALADLLQRSQLATWQGTPCDALLELAGLEVDLGHHDEAEALLRRLRRDGPPEAQGAGHLLLGRIAVTRQEPWAEEILDEAEAAGLSDPEAAQVALLRVERAIRQHHGEQAQRWLERARQLARAVASRPLLAAVALAEGDTAKVLERTDDARAAYQRGLSLLDRIDDPEIRNRLHLRLGDLALAADRLREAESQYLVAAQGFARHELPVREGWALLRLARVTAAPRPFLDATRERFLAAELAAGLAALDAAAGDPGFSLAWHLERATAHARARLDAQRVRPPWTRADADRPERRLGAHRLAIAACSVEVVHALTHKMDACARSMSAGRVRALDQAVLEYIASVDLLAAHPSWEAARALLDHLLRRVSDGPARRALQGAIARSPNAALVDGLLSVVERSHEHPAPAVAEAAELLGLRGERAAVDALCAIAAPGANPTARKAAIVALGRIGDRRVVEHLLPALEDNNLAEVAALALLTLGDRRGVDFHGRALSEDRRDLSGSPGEIVGRYGGSSYLLLLMNAARGNDASALGALQGLGLLGDPRAVPTLLEALSNRDHRTVEVASGALQILTGRAEDMEKPGARARWHQWWDANGDRFTSGVRYRDGAPFALGLLLKRMEHQDAWVRRTAYDELVIASGCALPFDSDGPWRVQRAHLAAWHAWWAKAKHRMPAGHWYLDGQPLG